MFVVCILILSICFKLTFIFWYHSNRQTKSVPHIRFYVNHYQVSCNLLRHLRSQPYYVQSFTYPRAAGIRAVFLQYAFEWLAVSHGILFHVGFPLLMLHLTLPSLKAFQPL